MAEKKGNGVATPNDLLTPRQAALYIKRDRSFLDELMAGGLVENKGTAHRPKVRRGDLEAHRLVGDSPPAAASQEKPAPASEETPSRAPSAPSRTFPRSGPVGLDGGQLITDDDDDDDDQAPLFPLTTRAQRRRRRRWDEWGLTDGEEAAPAPEDLYEEWRTDPTIWQAGHTTLFVRVREVDSNTFVPLNPNYLAEMPPYEDMAASFGDGALIEVSIKGPRNAKGKRRTIKGPLTLAIAPRGEYQMSGFGNPYGYGARSGLNGGLAGAQSNKEWINLFAQMTQQQRQDVSAQGNQWMALLSSPAFTQQKNDMAPMFQMMMMQQQTSQEIAARQAEANKQLLVGIVTALAPVLAALISKDDKTNPIELVTQMMSTLNASNSEQNKILLAAILNKDDIGKQLELFEKFKALTEDTPLGEIAKIVDAAGLGNAINTLAQAGANRLQGGESAPPAIEPPPAPANQPAAPANPYVQPPPQQPTAAQNTTTIDSQEAAAKEQFKTLLTLINGGFVGGEDPKELAATFWEQNKEYKANILQYQPAQIAELAKNLGPALGFPQLGGTDAHEFTLDFSTEVRRLALASEV